MVANGRYEARESLMSLSTAGENLRTPEAVLSFICAVTLSQTASTMSGDVQQGTFSELQQGG